MEHPLERDAVERVVRVLLRHGAWRSKYPNVPAPSTRAGPRRSRPAPEAVKAFALEKGAPRLALRNEHLTGREWLLDGFTVADALLATVLNWTAAAPDARGATLTEKSRLHPRA